MVRWSQERSVLNIGQAPNTCAEFAVIWHCSEFPYPEGLPTHVPPLSSVHGPLVTVKTPPLGGGGGLPPESAAHAGVAALAQHAFARLII